MEEFQSFGKPLTRKQAAEYLSISLPILDKFTRNNNIPHGKIGSRVRYFKSELDAYLKVNYHKN